MLVTTVHLPPLYQERKPGVDDVYNTAATYPSILHALATLVENGIILADAEQRTLHCIRQYIELWPLKYRQRALSIMSILRKRNRIIPVVVSDILDPECKKGCALALAVARTGFPDLTLSPLVCRCRESCGAGQISTVSLEDFELALAALPHQQHCQILGEGEWNKDKFTDMILKPMFAYARKVHLFDKQLGRSVTDEVRRERESGRNRQVQVRPRFGDSLQWILKIYDSYSHNPQSFEIVTEVGPLNSHGILESDICESGQILRRFTNRTLRGKHIDASVVVKVAESDTLQMHHDRYLMTDQVAVLFGRGFDLIRGDGTIRSTTLMLADFDQKDAVLTAVNRLRDVDEFGSSLHQLLRSFE